MKATVRKTGGMSSHERDGGVSPAHEVELEWSGRRRLGQEPCDSPLSARTINGVQPIDRFELADMINAAVLRTPVLPDAVPTDAAEPKYVVARIRELLAIWHHHGLEVTAVFIRADLDLIDAVGSIDAVDGIPVIFDNDVDVDTARGAFICEPQAASPVAALLRPALGIAYAGHVAPAVHETRWVLQEHDRLPPDLAQDIADII